MATVKEEARQVIERLPEHATWDDLIYELYVRQKIAAGIKAAGRRSRSHRSPGLVPRHSPSDG